MTPHWIAEKKIAAIDPEGVQHEVTLGIGQPSQQSEIEWACSCKFEPLYPDIPPLSGVDALQSLFLAMKLLGTLLSSLRDDGWRLAADGEALEIEFFLPT